MSGPTTTRSDVVATGRDPDGAEVISAFHRVDPPGWWVFVEEPLSEAFAPIQSAIWRTALLLVVFLLVAIATSVLLARNLVRPIQSIQVAAGKIGSGALDQRIKVSSRDELGALAEEFNRMAGQLQASYSGLEHQVDDRTRELTSALSRLDEQARELEAVSQHKSQFLANMSHELRTPLNAISGFSQVLRKQLYGEINEKQAEYLDDILASARHLELLIDDVLDLSKVEAGQIELQRGAILAARGARSRGRDRPRASDEGRRPNLALVGARHAHRHRRRAPGQAGDLQPALERGEVHARRRHSRRRGGADRWGDARFRQRQRARDRQGRPGTDLRGIPAGHRGQGAARGNRARAGAVEAPRRAARWAHLGRKRAWEGKHVCVHAACTTDPVMAGEQILMVEDNAKNMTLLRDVLRATGYRTLEASTGGQALTLATERGPALVLMDIRLPDMDGVEALRRLRSDERTASIPVLAITAEAMDGDREAVPGRGLRWLSLEADRHR